MDLNGKQIISIVGAILSALMISSAQLTDVFGPGVAKTAVSVAGLGNLILQSIMAALTSQSSTVKDVRSMPGVQHIEVNEKASAVLATLAMDPTETKIAPSQSAATQVEATATAAKAA